MDTKLLTKAEVATLFSVSPRTINHWLTARFLPAYRRGNVLRFRPDEIDAALLKMRVPAAGELRRRIGRINQPINVAKELVA